MESELKELGLGEYEQKAYITLLKKGSLNGRELSKKSGVPQSKIYESLYKLADKGFVSILDLRPKKFKANDPEVAIKSCLEQKRKKLNLLEQDIPKELKKLKLIKTEPETDETITVYKGKKDLSPLIADKYIVAKKYVKDMITFEYLPYSVIREMKKCLERGVDIKLLATRKDKTTMKLIKEVKKMGFNIRYYPVMEIRLSVRDGIDSYQFFVNPKNSSDRTAIVIESKELTKALEHYFDHIWEKAEKL